MIIALDPATTTVSAVARRFPVAPSVFERHHIDYCCGGARLMVEACTSAGVDLRSLLDEIAIAQHGDGDPQPYWEDRPLAELCRFIVDRYHAPLRARLADLQRMAVRVATAHMQHHPRLLRLADLVGRLADEIGPHLDREERSVFPLITALPASMAVQAIARLKREHADHGVLFERMAKVSDGFIPPEDACGEWHGLYLELRDCERELHEHTHLENNVLFARVLDAARPPSAGAMDLAPK